MSAAIEEALHALMMACAHASGSVVDITLSKRAHDALRRHVETRIRGSLGPREGEPLMFVQPNGTYVVVSSSGKD